MKGGLCYYSHVTFYMYHYTFGGLGASGLIRATRMGTDQPADFAARMATEYKFRCIKITAPSAKTACRAKARCRPVLLFRLRRPPQRVVWAHIRQKIQW